MTNMDTSGSTEAIDQDRRRVLGTATLGIAVASAASLLPSQMAAAPAGDAIRPFRIDVPDEALIDLRRRLAATRWPERERSQMNRKACSCRLCRSSRAIGRRITTGARSRRS